MKFLIGGIAHETNTFSQIPTDVAAFKEGQWAEGEKVLLNRGVRNYIGGMIDRAEALKIPIQPLFSAFATPSGMITKQAHVELFETFLANLRTAEDYDAILLSLHGAGISEYTEDLEGDFLYAVRQEVGDQIPIILTLDLHANVTEKMIRLADLVLGNHLYPHTDSYEIGQEAVDLAQAMVEGRIRPRMHLEQLPLAVPTISTDLEPAKEINEWCLDAESLDGVIDCTFYHGFPYTDIKRFGVSVLVTTEDDQELAERTAKAVGQAIWQERQRFLVKQAGPEAGIQEALAYEGEPVVINETSDNPGAGAPGDGTYLLEALLQADLKRACFASIYDPEVVQAALAKGVGEELVFELGAKTDQLHGRPLKLQARIKAITDGRFRKSTPMGKGQLVNLGPSVRFYAQGVDFIVCSRRSQIFDDEIFKLHGIDVSDYKIVALKSSQHFRAGFAPLTSKIITVDSPGLSTLDFTSFNYQNLQSKLYPFHTVSYDES